MKEFILSSHVYDQLLQHGTPHSMGRKKNTHPVGIKQLDRRITDEVFRWRINPSKQVSKIWISKDNLLTNFCYLFICADYPSKL